MHRARSWRTLVACLPVLVLGSWPLAGEETLLVSRTPYHPPVPSSLPTTPVSLEADRAFLSDVLADIGQQVGEEFELELGDHLEPWITLRLKDVPCDRALAMIAGLGWCEIEGSKLVARSAPALVPENPELAIEFREWTLEEALDRWGEQEKEGRAAMTVTAGPEPRQERYWFALRRYPAWTTLKGICALYGVRLLWWPGVSVTVGEPLTRFQVQTVVEGFVIGQASHTLRYAQAAGGLWFSMGTYPEDALDPRGPGYFELLGGRTERGQELRPLKKIVPLRLVDAWYPGNAFFVGEDAQSATFDFWGELVVYRGREPQSYSFERAGGWKGAPAEAVLATVQETEDRLVMRFEYELPAQSWVAVSLWEPAIEAFDAEGQPVYLEGRREVKRITAEADAEAATWRDEVIFEPRPEADLARLVYRPAVLTQPQRIPFQLEGLSNPYYRRGGR